MPNRLINEPSLYLQQHAENPVNWYPWCDEAFEEAKRLRKPVLISIGYSACHWCHVMEHESFENEEIAGIMNEHFICIKVDREERPDVDHLYMNAVQHLTGRGGWPLNCFALPDERPFWGGTYFRPEQWKLVLTEISRLFNEEHHLLQQQADEVLNRLRDLPLKHSSRPMNAEFDLQIAIRKITQQFDYEYGGLVGAPKFPMPVVWEWILNLIASGQKEELADTLETTLRTMARGGIYDQAGGGFARYSTDREWKVPHFEKMLYDNAQLLSLYSNAFRLQQNAEYKRVAISITDFLLRDLSSDEGMFYSAIDADSEGQEGRYYTWTPEEFNMTLGQYGQLAGEYFGIGSEGLWEEGRNILLSPHEDILFAQRHFLSETELHSLLDHCRKLLLAERQKRIPPATDTKMIVSWNALAIKGFVNAAMAFQEVAYLETAMKTADFILRNQMDSSGHLMRICDEGGSRIPAFLDDYAFLADAFLELFSVTTDTKWLNAAVNLTETAYTDFYDSGSGYFFYSQEQSASLVNTFEIHDQVLPSSNAVMASVLFRLGFFLDRDSWISASRKMCDGVISDAQQHPAAFAAWLRLIQDMQQFRVVAVLGPQTEEFIRQLYSEYIPSVMIAGSLVESELPYFKGRYEEGSTRIHICTADSCHAPVPSVKEAMEVLRSQGTMER